jgi:hypothetical protein
MMRSDRSDITAVAPKAFGAVASGILRAKIQCAEDSAHYTRPQIHRPVNSLYSADSGLPIMSH